MRHSELNLKSINLGADSAEDDIKIGLEQYFIKTPEFQEISAGSKSIIIGNRGSGKSAIFKYMAKQSRTKGDICIELSPDEFIQHFERNPKAGRKR
jgi:ABC-type cobalamin/Fe3+-siderophores transport system ATPase subunit